MLRLLALLVTATGLVAGESLLDPTAAEFAGAETGPDGTAFAFDMGTQRTNWNRSAWAIHDFAEVRDLSPYAGLLIAATTDAPRDDAAVYVALKEADGSWHYRAWAVDLTREENARTVRFDEFRPAYWCAPHVHGMPKDHFDQNQHLDTGRIASIAFGCVNPFGIGEVAYTVTAVDLVPAEESEPGPVRVVVDGRTMRINDTEMLPGGLFGHFPGGGTREMRIGSHREIHHSYLSHDDETGELRAKKQCEDPAKAVPLDVKGGDRYSSSGRLTNADWQRRYRGWGLGTGRTLEEYYRRYDREIVIEWWNEPYLNWSNRSRKNFDPRFFDSSRAKEGGPVHLSVDGQIAPFLRWTKDYDAPPWNWAPRDRWRVGLDEKGRRVKRAHPPADVADGETFVHEVYRKVKDPDTGKKVRRKVGEKILTAHTPWHVYDETQFTFWSGKSQLKFYNEPMLAFGRGLKQAYPQAKYVVGWDFRPSEDHWAGFRMLYKPTIDAAIDLIHGVTDHDYGGDVTRMPANYETIAAYGMAYHDRFLYSYNSECGENSDPSANPQAAASMEQTGKKWLKTQWCARKIVHAAATVPDKARSFTFHWFDKGAEGIAMTAMRNLRGRLVHATSADPEVYVVASIDGTDPSLPRPDYLEPGEELVVAIFNDHGDPVEVTVPVTAPAGTAFTGGVLRRPVPEQGDNVVRLEETALEVGGTSFAWNGEIRGKGLAVLSFTLDGQVADEPQVVRVQRFADDVLRDVRPGESAELHLHIEKGDLDGVERIWLRGVFERVAAGEGTLTLNGTELAVPRCNTPENVCWIREIPIDASLLQEGRNELTFAVADDTQAGYLVCMASVMIEGEP